MNLTTRLQYAINLSSRLHQNQIRKDFVRTPYISHLVSTMILLSEITDDEDILIAGIMHDALEDVPDYSYEDLKKDCGETVALLVKGVTEPLDANLPDDMQMPWMDRKKAYLETLRNANDKSILISVADKTHNLGSLIYDLEENNHNVFKRAVGNLDKVSWFYEELLSLFKERLGNDHSLVLKYSKALTDAKEALSKYENK